MWYPFLPFHGIHHPIWKLAQITGAECSTRWRPLCSFYWLFGCCFPWADHVRSPTGPDAQGEYRLALPSGSPHNPAIHLYFFCAVLHLRGVEVMPQPVVDAAGNVLCWNGEIFDGIEVARYVLLMQFADAVSYIYIYFFFLFLFFYRCSKHRSPKGKTTHKSWCASSRPLRAMRIAKFRIRYLTFSRKLKDLTRLCSGR